MCGYCAEAYQIAAEEIDANDVSQNATASTSYVARANQDWDGILHNDRWSISTINFSFPTSASAYNSPYHDSRTATFSTLNSTQRSAVRDLLDEIESFTGLNFNEVSGNSSSSVMRFGNTNTNTPTAVGYFPASSYEEAGDTWYGNGNYDNPVLGSYAYNEGFMHEIGHALGLEHGHSSGSYGALSLDVDSNEFSVMTYRDHVGDGTANGSGNETWGNAQSYMMFDIAALQYMYGADYSSSGNTWSGTSVYTFSTTTGEMFINGVGQGTPGGNRIFRTIWDGNGEDTYDLSNYSTQMLIDLRPGEWSIFDVDQLADLDGGSRTTNLARGNVANALLYDNNLASLIENAIGGSNNDILVGNVGNNRLEGRAGEDLLLGGLGNDHLMGGDNNDRLVGDRAAATGSGILSSAYGSNNYTRQTATSVDNLFSTDYNQDIELSSVLPHVTVLGVGDGNVKYFSFTVLTPNSTVILDIDNARTTTGGFDSMLQLLDSSGNVIASNDDSAVRNGGTGSGYTTDSYIAQEITTPGVYYVAVSQFSGFSGIDNYDTFQLHITVGGAVVDNGTAVSAGDDLIDGGAGDDTAYFASNRADVQIMSFLEGIVTDSVNDGTDRILNTEYFQFIDQLTSTSIFTPTYSIYEYGASHADLMAAIGANSNALLEHYALSGMGEGRTVTFNALEYIASYADLSSQFGADRALGAIHYINAGMGEGRTTTFDALEYIASHSDLLSNMGSDASAGASHYINYGRNEGRQSTFDGLEYIASYADLISAFGTNEDAATLHYINNGFNEGRTTSFDARYYLGNYADLRAVFGTDLDAATNHYIQNGFNEGRNADFNFLEYIASYGDLISTLGLDTNAAMSHYINNGFNEGRADLFDANAYLNASGNSDLLTAFGTDLDAAVRHYIEYGFNEGRLTA